MASIVAGASTGRVNVRFEWHIGDKRCPRWRYIEETDASGELTPSPVQVGLGVESEEVIKAEKGATGPEAGGLEHS